MSRLAARWFAWVQSSPAYRQLHLEAVHHLPPGQGRSWLDVGCGPGLMTRLAADHGYQAHGIDHDPAMIDAARRLSRTDSCRFTVGDLTQPLPQSDVVCAASLLCQLPDPEAGLELLWEAVRPGGTLLIIETAALMTPQRARTATASRDRRSRQVLTAWARARQGRNLPAGLWANLPEASVSAVPLLDGCVQAVFIDRGHPSRLV